jgi:hypothetical protein
MRAFFIFLVAAVAHAQEYFPSGVFSAQPEVDRRAASSYASVLEAFGEQPLFSLSPPEGVECYRFIWLRAFARPVVLRLTVLKGGDGTLVIKVGEAANPPLGDYQTVKLVREEKKRLDQRAVGRFRSYVDLSDLYTIPQYDTKVGFDGAMWVFEAISYGKYHIVSRWSPKDGAVREVGTRLIYLAIGGDLLPIY